MEKMIYPVDSANFRRIREKGFVYVDKTRFINLLTENFGTYYFLARPRRFGKSLFLDTLAEFFKGNRSLFNGLEIDALIPGEWESYPVLRLNLAGKDYVKPESLDLHIHEQLQKFEREFELESSSGEIEGRFDSLIHNVAVKTGKGAVILIDEYDAPLSSSIDNPRLQEIYRNKLHGFYSVLKNREEHIRFCILTGVTRYGKVSVFSGLNNLKDITFLDEYAAICGITAEELSQYYSEGLESLARRMGLTPSETLDALKFNYDGYHFSPAMVDIYNPFSINNAFDNGVIKDYWCRSGVPTILSRSLMQNDYDVETLNGRKVPESELTDLSIDSVDPIPLFYQTGYLTIKDYEERRQRYTLGYPNREVEAAIMSNILKVYTHSTDQRQGLIYDMEDSLESGNPGLFIKQLSSFLSGIPNQLHKHVGRYENYYHTIFYCLTYLIGMDVEAEYSTSEGFIDILIKTKSYIYIIELKVNGSAKDAMAQIEKKHYAAQFEVDGRTLVKIGLGFSPESHNLSSHLIDLAN